MFRRRGRIYDVEVHSRRRRGILYRVEVYVFRRRGIIYDVEERSCRRRGIIYSVEVHVCRRRGIMYDVEVQYLTDLTCLTKRVGALCRTGVFSCNPIVDGIDYFRGDWQALPAPKKTHAQHLC